MLQNELLFFEQLTWRKSTSVSPESVDVLAEQAALYPELDLVKCHMLASIFRAFPEVTMQQLGEIARILQP